MSDAGETRTDLQQAVELIRWFKQRNAKLEAERHEPIAIVSMACRFPGAVDSPEKYWKLLAEGEERQDALSRV